MTWSDIKDKISTTFGVAYSEDNCLVINGAELDESIGPTLDSYLQYRPNVGKIIISVCVEIEEVILFCLVQCSSLSYYHCIFTQQDSHDCNSILSSSHSGCSKRAIRSSRTSVSHKSPSVRFCYIQNILLSWQFCNS